MDMQTACNLADDSYLSEIAHCKVVVGAKQLRKALISGSAQRVYLARNADPALTEPLMELCQNNKVPAFWVSTMAALGKACGIEVGAAAAATLKSL